MSAIFEPIHKDVKPVEAQSGTESKFFSQYAKADPVENENWKFGQKAPMPDNMLLSAIHNLLHKNSLA